MVPDTTVHLVDKDAEKMQTLIDALEDNDDVQNVYSNYEMGEEVEDGLSECRQDVCTLLRIRRC